MNFEFSSRQLEWQERLKNYFDRHIAPAEVIIEEQMAAARASGNPWSIPPKLEELRRQAKADGLWNLFLPGERHGAGLTNLEYAPLAEMMGHYHFAPEVFNCAAPDTGNMEILALYGSEAVQRAYLDPLLEGEIRSAFLMTEPAVASSDATNIETRIERDGDDYVLNGTKWWSSSVGDPRVAFFIVMGKTNPDEAPHRQQSQIVVPAGEPGVRVKRMLPVFGFDHAPYGHGEVELKDVRVPAANILLGEGRGFEIAQARLGPGRIHHCMRSIGAAEKALQRMIERLLSRTAFGARLAHQGVWEERVANARIEIEMARLLTFKAADMMDKLGNKAARSYIAQIKVAAPNMAVRVIDDAIQAWGGAGVSTDSGLAELYADQRAMRIVDGPDEVHRRTIAQMEFRRVEKELAAA